MSSFAEHREAIHRSPSYETGLLVSVRDADEARLALSGGADWIDLKEPDSGALGAVSESVAREVVALVAGRVPVSAAGGELLDWSSSPAHQLLTVPGIHLIKLGLAGCSTTENWFEDWSTAAREIGSAGKQLVAVAYADWQQAKAPSVEEIVDRATQIECQTLLIDTYDKSAGTLLTHLPSSSLVDVLRGARHAGMKTVLAGKLKYENLGNLPLEWVDLVAVRGAACSGTRSDSISAAKVAALLSHLRGLSRDKIS